MVCHMLGILTSEEFDKLALDDINIPHGQWTLTLVLSHCPSEYVVTLVVNA